MNGGVRKVGVCGYTGWVGREGGWGWETEDGRRGEGEVRWERGEAMVMEIWI